jgi:hypothetical protein
MVAMSFERISTKPRKARRAYSLESLFVVAFGLAFMTAGAAIAIIAKVHP